MNYWTEKLDFSWTLRKLSAINSAGGKASGLFFGQPYHKTILI